MWGKQFLQKLTAKILGPHTAKYQRKCTLGTYFILHALLTYCNITYFLTVNVSHDSF